MKQVVDASKLGKNGVTGAIEGPCIARNLMTRAAPHLKR